jgi:hypothetical protein
MGKSLNCQLFPGFHTKLVSDLGFIGENYAAMLLTPQAMLHAARDLVLFLNTSDPRASLFLGFADEAAELQRTVRRVLTIEDEKSRHAAIEKFLDGRKSPVRGILMYTQGQPALAFPGFPTADAAIAVIFAELIADDASVTIRKCKRPSCEQFLVREMRRRGRPQLFCPGCKPHRYEEIEIEKARAKNKR